MTDKNEEKKLVESELHVIASDELEEEVSADLLLPEGDIQLNSMFGEAMYFTPPVYTFPIDGDATEKVTFEEGKIWKNPPVDNGSFAIADDQGIPKPVSKNRFLMNGSISTKEMLNGK